MVISDWRPRRLRFASSPVGEELVLSGHGICDIAEGARGTAIGQQLDILAGQHVTGEIRNDPSVTGAIRARNC